MFVELTSPYSIYIITFISQMRKINSWGFFACACARMLCRLAVADSLRPFGLWSARVLSPWDSPGKNTGVGCVPSSRGSSQPRNQICVSRASCIAGESFTCWAIRKTLWLTYMVIKWWSQNLKPENFTPLCSFQIFFFFFCRIGAGGWGDLGVSRVLF